MGKSLCLQLWLSGTHTIDSNTAIILYLCLLHMQLQHSYKKLYLILDNGSLTFTGDPHEVLLHKTFSILVYNLPLPTLPSLLFPSLLFPFLLLFFLLFPSLFPLSQGISYLVNMGVLEDSPQGIAEFIHNTSALDWNSLRKFLQDRSVQR